MGKDAAQGLARNVRRLMENSGMSQMSLAIKAKVSQKTVSDLLNYGRTASKSPRIGTIEKIAAVFDVSPWLILNDDLPLELLLNKRVEKLVDNFSSADEKGRENVERIAEVAMEYHALKGKKAG